MKSERYELENVLTALQALLTMVMGLVDFFPDLIWSFLISCLDMGCMVLREFSELGLIMFKQTAKSFEFAANNLHEFTFSYDGMCKVMEALAAILLDKHVLCILTFSLVCWSIWGFIVSRWTGRSGFGTNHTATPGAEPEPEPDKDLEKVIIAESIRRELAEQMEARYREYAWRTWLILMGLHAVGCLFFFIMGNFLANQGADLTAFLDANPQTEDIEAQRQLASNAFVVSYSADRRLELLLVEIVVVTAVMFGVWYFSK